LGQSAEAIEDYTQALKLDPKEVFIYRQRGDARLRLNQYLDAVDDYTQALKTADDPAAILSKRADANFGAQDYAHAAQDYDNVVKLNPTDLRSLDMACQVRALWGQQFDVAIAYCDKAIQLQPAQGHFHWTRALVEYRAGHFSDAAADADTAFKLNPNSASALYLRGMAKRKLGDMAGGDADLASAKAMQADVIDNFKNFGM